MNYILNLLNKFSFLFLILFFLSSCGKIWDPADARKVPTNAKDRVAKNIEEGRGFKIMGKKQGGTFQFASQTATLLALQVPKMFSFLMIRHI